MQHTLAGYVFYLSQKTTGGVGYDAAAIANQAPNLEHYCDVVVPLGSDRIITYQSLQNTAYPTLCLTIQGWWF